MEIASSVADPQELRRLAEDRLSVPSPHSRRSSLALVQKAYLDDLPRCADPVVLAWQGFRDAVVKVRGVPKDDLLIVLRRIWTS